MARFRQDPLLTTQPPMYPDGGYTSNAVSFDPSAVPQEICMSVPVVHRLPEQSFEVN